MADVHDAELLELAGALARKAGCPPPLGLVSLAGGRNNRVYRVDAGSAAPSVLKCYFNDPRDPRDRLAAEWSFIAAAWALGVRALPEPLAQDPGRHAALYGFVPGRKLAAGAVSQEHVVAAADFVRSVNGAAPRDGALPAASEACFSLTEHIATVKRRVARLSALAPDVPARAEAEELIRRRLLPAWHMVEARIADCSAARDLQLDERIANADCCLSPSDFGFHNALLADDGTLAFLDFEYAGRDDPAKLVCDFFCQPEVPVPLQHLEVFVQRIASSDVAAKRLAARCDLLLDAYRVKWTCIMLNDFLAVGAARRAFAEAGGWERRCRTQLAKAEAKLAEIRSSNDD